MVLTLPDGARLFVRVFEAERSRGTVVIVHGVGEHSGRYAHVVEMLLHAGWSVVVYDHRGHGQSSGARGAIPRTTTLLDDLAHVIDHVHPRRLVLLGHSMGGVIAAELVAKKRRHVDALILSSPALALEMSLKNRIKLAVFSRLTPNISLPNRIDATKISHDAEIVERYRTDPSIHDRVTPRLVKFMRDAGAHVRRLAPRWRVPTLLLWSGSDALVSARGSVEFAAAAPREVVAAHEFRELYHEIFNETEPARAEVLRVVSDWLSLRCEDLEHGAEKHENHERQ